MIKKYRIAIIGAGPAGIACAIQLKRYGIDFILFEKNKPGGLLLNANFVENYLGFPKGISGKKLVNLFCQQMVNSRIKIVRENVINVDYKNNRFKIKTSKGNYLSEILIIASGTKPKRLILPIPNSVQSRVFYEAINLERLKNKEIAIVGSGDSAFDYSLNLSRKNRVVILNRSHRIKCLPLLFQRCMRNNKIRYYPSFDLSNLEYKDKKLILYAQDKKVISCDYLLVAIGREPNLDFLSVDLKRRLKILERNKKLYIIGDVKNGLFRQTAIAIGDGIRVAMEIAKLGR